MQVERKDLVVGKIYFIDGSRKTKGVFKGRDENGIYFDCDENSPYATRNVKGQEHLTPFNEEGDGFLEVPLGDGPTDEDVQLINVGDKVKVLEQGGSRNPKGSIGIVTEVEYQSMRVLVEGCTDDNFGNWHSEEELELIQQ